MTIHPASHQKTRADDRGNLLNLFKGVRNQSEQLCHSLETEDYQLSAFSEVGLKPDDSISPMFRILRAST